MCAHMGDEIACARLVWGTRQAIIWFFNVNVKKARIDQGLWDKVG